MKLCPNCQSNVEGLIHHCDCCGLIFEKEPKYLLWHCFEFSSDFHINMKAFMESIDQKAFLPYKDFLEKVYIDFCCYPNALLEQFKMKSRVRYSAKKKTADIMVTVDYHTYIYAEKKGKQQIVIHAILEALTLLEKRLSKEKRSIADFIKNTETILLPNENGGSP